MAQPAERGVWSMVWSFVFVLVMGLEAATGAAAPQEAPQTEPPSESETSPAPPTFEAEIAVTGTLIPRPDLEALSPVTVMEPEEIAATGLTRLEDLLTTLPQVYPGQNATIANGASGTATVDLRNLGTVRTLVLVNGRRLPAGDAQVTVPDLNFIPPALIKRIDILTGGASSVYGADAVAGVVNFVLDTRLEGFRGGVGYGIYQHDNDNQLAQEINTAAGYDAPTGSTWDGGVAYANAAYGAGFASGRGHATVYLDYRNTDSITRDRRDYANCTALASAGGPYCGGSITIPEGLFYAFAPNFSYGIPYVLDPVTNRLRLPVLPDDYYNYSAVNHLQRPDERWLGGAFAEYRFAPQVEGYLELMLMDDSTDAQIAPSADFGSTRRLNCDNPMLSDEQRALLCTRFGYSDDDYANVVIHRRSVETGNRIDSLRHTAWRLLTGLRGDLGAHWSYDVYALWTDVQISESYQNEVNVSRMADALDVVGDPSDPSTWRCRSGNPGCVPWNIFQVGGVTREAADFIRTRAESDSSTSTKMIDGTIVGDLEAYGWKLPGGVEGVQIALGATYRREGLTIAPDEVFREGDAAGFGGPLPAVDGEYSVAELYAEGLVPILQSARGAEDLSVELGYRLSDYNLAGTHPTWKAQLSWMPVRGFRLRGGVARAVRAPNVIELFTPQVPGVGGTDICANDPDTGQPQASFEECARTGVTPEQYGNILAHPGGLYNTIEGGNLALVPETGDTATVGLVLDGFGLRGLSAALDYYDIRMEETIEAPGAAGTINACARTGDPVICGLIHRDAAGSLWLTPDGYTLNIQQNVGARRSRGVDLNLGYLRSVGSADFLELSLVGTYLMERSIDGPSFAYDCAGYFGHQCRLPSPRWQHRAMLAWETGFDTVFNLRWRMIGPVTNDDLSPDGDLASPTEVPDWEASGSAEVAAYHYLDLSASYNFSAGVQLTVGINNLLDKEPPLVAGFIGNDFGAGMIGMYDPWGRFIHADLRFTF
jgi:outer membrane receptor protein involved in Fe transport